MEWNEFLENVVKDLPGVFEEEGYSVQVWQHRVEKLQNASYDALAVAFEGSQIGILYPVMEEYEAAVMTYPGFMEEAAKIVGGNFYLLPSSLEEVILVPEKHPKMAAALEFILQDVNESIVDPSIVLSDRVYHYDAAAKLFERADVYEMRREVEQIVGGSRSSVMVALEAAKEASAKMSKAPGRDRHEPSR